MSVDLILICQSNVVDSESYAKLPLDRLEMFDTLVYPRMVRHRDGFIGHLDLINAALGRPLYAEADDATRRDLLNVWHLPSMSGVHLANYLLGHGVTVRLINNIDSEWDRFEAAYKAAPRPPLVGISSTFYLAPKQIGRLAKRVLMLDPNAEIVVGGALVNGLAENGSAKIEAMMRRQGLTYALHAFNSEADLRDLLLARRKGSGEDQVRNLCILKGGVFTATAAHWNEPALEEVPALWDRLELPFLNRTLQIRTASGCPFACAFCSYPTTARGWMTMEAERVRAHLDAIARIPGVRQLIFIDDTFNVPKERFKALLRILCEYQFEWFSFLRVQYVDEEIVGLMKRSGCRGVYLGVESASDTILANMNKKARRDDFARGVTLLAKYGITALAAFVLGFPGETDETLGEITRFLAENPVPYYSLKEFFYMENTKVHAERDHWGLTGMGNNWAHKTMDYQTATRRKLDLFGEIRTSSFVDPDTSLWYLATLADQGLGDGQIAGIQREINGIMHRQLGGDFSEDPKALARIAAFYRGE